VNVVFFRAHYDNKTWLYT